MIGIYGGSFDPVHLGHLKTATSIKNELAIKRLFLLPCYEPVHKGSLKYSTDQRLKMLSLQLKIFLNLRLIKGKFFVVEALI